MKSPVFNRAIISACLIVLAVVIAGAGMAQTATSGESAPAYAKTSAFSLKTADGTELNYPVADAGPHILFFWATWCPYCKQLMPHLQSMIDESGGKLKVYAINFRDDGDPSGYLELNGYEFDLLVDGDEVAKQYGITGTPGVLVIDGQQQIRMNLNDLLAPTNKALDGLRHGQRSRRIAPWWAAQIRKALDEIKHSAD